MCLRSFLKHIVTYVLGLGKPPQEFDVTAPAPPPEEVKEPQPMELRAERSTSAHSGDHFASYHVWDAARQPSTHHFDIYLTCFEDEVAPTEFELYIWHAAYGASDVWDLYRPEQFRRAVEVITGRKVKSAREESGNGHGVVYVEYAD